MVCFGFFFAQNKIAKGYRSRSWNISTAETKILVILCYYAIFGIVSLTYFALAIADLDEFMDAILEYLVCEGAGSQVECDRSQFEQYTYFGLVMLTFLLPGFLPCVNLVFVIKWTAAKIFCRNIWVKLCTRVASKYLSTDNKAETMETTLE